MRNNTMNDQMELTLQPRTIHSRNRRRTHAPKTAQWWFRHMRQVVAEAVEWSAPRPSQPEQADLALTNSKA